MSRIKHRKASVPKVSELLQDPVVAASMLVFGLIALLLSVLEFAKSIQ